MDTITQGLLGAVTGQLGFRQKIGRETSYVAAIAAVLPDLDILLQPFVTLSGAEYEHYEQYNHAVMHRGLTHSLLFVPVAAALLAGTWWWFRRNGTHRKSFGLLFACMFAAQLSHPLLDWCTSYGTQLLSPFTSQRYALDLLPIVDFVYTPLLVLTLLSCYVVRRATKQSTRATLTTAWIGFALSLAYVTLAAVNHQRAIAFAAAQWQQEDAHYATLQQPDKATTISKTHTARLDKQKIYRAYPQIGMAFLWRVTCFDGQHWQAGRVNLLYDKSVRTFENTRVRAPDNHWVADACQTAMGRQFQWFAMGQVRAEYARQDDRHVVVLHDMRYGLSPASMESLWPAQITFSSKDNASGTERIVLGHHDRSMAELTGKMWRQIWTP